MNEVKPSIKHFLFGCLLGSFFLGSSTASAELLTYEGFHYDRRQWSESGTEAEGIDGLHCGFGWDGPWEETESKLTGIAAESRDVTDLETAGARTRALSYTDARGRRLLSEPGQARTATSSASWAIRPLARPLGIPGETAWVSFLVQAKNTTNSYSFLSLNNTDSDDLIQLGLVNPSQTPNWGYLTPDDWGAPGPEVTEQVFYLVKIEYPLDTDVPLNVSVWFNPLLENESDLGNPSTFSAPHRQINYLHIRGRTSIDVDEIRIGTTFDSVTPHGPFQENLKIDRAVTVKFDTEWGKEYQIFGSKDGTTWKPLIAGLHLGNGQEFEASFAADYSPENIRVLVTSEAWTPDPNAEPTLSVLHGLRMHMDASPSESLTLDGIHVTEWRDAQGNDIIFTPLAIAGKDTRPSYGTSGPNGRPVLTFSQSALDSISPEALSLANDIEGITLFTVVQGMPAGAQNIFRMSTHTNASTRFVQYRTIGENAINVTRTDDGEPFKLYGGKRVGAEEWGIDASVIDFMNSEAFLYRDGDEAGYLDALGEPGRTEASDSMGARIGASTHDTLANTWLGDIAEILYYDRVLTREERNQVGTYLSDKYDLPYKLTVELDIPFEYIPSVTLSFRADADSTYQIEWTNNLTGSWANIGAELAGFGFGERAYVTIDDGIDRKFFRLRKR